MYFAYLDEFGHIGPFISRTSQTHNESPVFGLAGIILPDCAIRPFATRFLQLKQHLFGDEIAQSRQIPQRWEKKGASIFRPKAVERYQELRTGGFRLINQLRSVGGRVFYHGREKVPALMDGNANGLYTTVLAHAIRRIDAFCATENSPFAIVLDEHSARKDLLECAQKTMYGKNPAHHLVSPPFEVESYLDQTMQAADWIAAIVGRLWAHESLPDHYADHGKFRAYYWDRLHGIATHSAVMRRQPL